MTTTDDDSASSAATTGRTRAKAGIVMFDPPVGAPAAPRDRDHEIVEVVRANKETWEHEAAHV